MEAEIASKEKNRAYAVVLNAEIRRTKARLLEEVPKLQNAEIRRTKARLLEEVPKLQRLAVKAQ
ncbi:syntaxin-71-like [Prunus yedoensis var. nudiflora]|uniref:Syntaxin-71-like n=1 Tax=Prunus yedoensis var. nudiflora TaxID=2094558 RepID=A0A314YXY6_PRUYE|nr:syntaxin-71-like [Prunus yedoensis var. nudiflora]